MNAHTDRPKFGRPPTQRPAQAEDQEITRDARLHVVVDPAPPFLVIGLHGELDVRSAAELENVTLGDLTRISSMVVDLSHLTFCDSTGMRALLDLQAAHVAPGREVRIANVSPVIRRLAVLMGQDHSVPA